MAFNQFQEKCLRTWDWDQAVKKLDGLAYITMGLAAESGEVANEIKKIWRDDGGVLTEERRNAIIDELGDVMWYAAILAEEIGEDLGAIAFKNTLKLEKRYNLKE